MEMSDDFKTRAESFYSKKGVSLADAIIDLISQDITEEDFDIDNSPYTEEEERLFYSESNLKHLDESIKQAEDGKFVRITSEQLRAMIK
jgi:hypothetical protein